MNPALNPLMNPADDAANQSVQESTMHPGVTSTAKYVRTLSSMVGAHPSVLYSQAVLRPSLALAQGHSLALIQGIAVNVNEWNVANEPASFDIGLRAMIAKLRKLCESVGWVCSVEIGDSITKGKHTIETLRISIRDDTTVRCVMLYASKTFLMHDIREEGANNTIDNTELFNIANSFCTANEPIEKGYINHVAIADGKITTSRNEVNDNGIIVDSCYPQITEGATAFIDRYLTSPSSVLNMYGKGGTGKSTLMLKAAARSQGRHVLLVDNPALYRDPVLTGNLMLHIRSLCAEGKSVLVLLEEVDNYIQTKDNDNDFLVQLLSMSSGVLKLDVKIMLASNLTNSDKILGVLQRGGRSFGSIEFGDMTVEQAQKCRADLGLPDMEFDSSYVTLADAICEKVVKIGDDKNRVGFTGK